MKKKGLKFGLPQGRSPPRLRSKNLQYKSYLSPSPFRSRASEHGKNGSRTYPWPLYRTSNAAGFKMFSFKNLAGERSIETSNVLFQVRTFDGNFKRSWPWTLDGNFERSWPRTLDGNFDRLIVKTFNNLKTFSNSFKELVHTRYYYF
jgi:hypothetical protein